MSEEINKLVAVHVMNNKWPVNIAPCTFGPDGLEDGGHDIFGTPAFSTDPAADYEVLKRVRETWARDRFMSFSSILAVICIQRSSWVSRNDVDVGAFYEPGDYSRAALLALGIHIPTQGAPA